MYKIESAADGGKAPNGPKFGLIAGIACVVILLMLVAAYFFGAFGERQFHVSPNAHPNSRLNVPALRPDAMRLQSS